MESIGVRELRQHASRYLARVRTGQSFQITDRGRPVARLVPTATGDTWEELLASGQVLPPEEEGDIADDPPVDYGISASEVLAEMRESER